MTKETLLPSLYSMDRKKISGTTHTDREENGRIKKVKTMLSILELVCHSSQPTDLQIVWMETSMIQGLCCSFLQIRNFVLYYSHRIYGQSLGTFVLFVYNLFTVELKTFEGQKYILLYHWNHCYLVLMPHLQILVILSRDHHTLPISCTLAFFYNIIKD